MRQQRLANDCCIAPTPPSVQQFREQLRESVITRKKIKQVKQKRSKTKASGRASKARPIISNCLSSIFQHTHYYCNSHSHFGPAAAVISMLHFFSFLFSYSLLAYGGLQQLFVFIENNQASICTILTERPCASQTRLDIEG
jgi:hypothetical protein